MIIQDRVKYKNINLVEVGELIETMPGRDNGDCIVYWPHLGVNGICCSMDLEKVDEIYWNRNSKLHDHSCKLSDCNKGRRK